jgi:hypothetical protein
MPMGIAASSASIGELQRDYLFRIEILRTPNGFKGSLTHKDNIDIYMTKGVFPNRKTEEIALKWAGESIYYSGVDGSPKTGDLVFRLPQNMGVKDLWEDLKDLTGDQAAHAAALKQNQTLDIAVYLISVNKKTVTEARKLENVLVFSVEDINLDKEGSGISTFKVHISWDRNSKMREAIGTILIPDPAPGAPDSDKLKTVTDDEAIETVGGAA